jgi:hypothetical protein
MLRKSVRSANLASSRPLPHPGCEAFGEGPAAFTIKVIRIDRMEVKPRYALAARVILDRRDEAAGHALAAEFRIELVQDHEADASEPTADESHEPVSGPPAPSRAW